MTEPEFVCKHPETGELYRSDHLSQARFLLLVNEPLGADEPTEESIADVIADVLHLAAASGVLIEDALDHGRRYYESDLEGPLL